jgi:cell division protein FtsI/penicillin-binding protein 2
MLFASVLLGVSRLASKHATPTPQAVAEPVQPIQLVDATAVDVAAGPSHADPAKPIPVLASELAARISSLRVAAAAEVSPGAPITSDFPVPDALAGAVKGPLRVEYSFDADLTRRVAKVLRDAHVPRGHVIALDPHSGRVLAYVSTDPDAFPPDELYPAASLVKVITAAAALHYAPAAAHQPCRYAGNPYRLNRWQIHKPRRGNEVSLERALASSNNHCFAQLAVDAIGLDALSDAIARFGWLESPGPGLAAGAMTDVENDFQLGQLGCGMAGCKITPMHAAQLAATLVDGLRVEPWWVERVIDADGREIWAPEAVEWRRVMTRELADQLRGMLVTTTTRGTARRSFAGYRGQSVLGPVKVAGKTGNLSGPTPTGGSSGRYEWFAGVAPADHPSVAIAVVQLHGSRWWKSSSWIASRVLVEMFCERGRCSPERAERFTDDLRPIVKPVFLSETGM